MQLRVLGPLTVVRLGAAVVLDVPKQRAVLAVLALAGGDVVSTSELIDAVWGDEPPTTAGKTLQTYVSALRRQLGDDAIETIGNGYALGDAVHEVDVLAFEQDVASGREHLHDNHPEAARRAFRGALAVWHGRPLTDLAPGPIRDGRTARLDELQLLATEGLVESELALGHHRDVVPDLELLVAEHPYREILWRLLMLALHRSGRTADALAAYRTLRQALVEQLGIEPSSATQALEVQILDRDPQIAAPAATAPTNLAAPLDSFVDREREQQMVLDLLGQHRLVTVLGIGGVGKSRLANEVGRVLLDETPGGVWWIDLAAAPTNRSILGQVATAIGLPAAPGAAPEGVVLARLRSAPTIVILDNCEHLLEPVAAFVEWLTSREPTVRMLTTSRFPIGVAGERHVRLEPLAAGTTDGSHGSDASRLFLDRATSDIADADLATVEALTRLVGGLPLGIEIAAAQCALRTPADLLRELDDRHGTLKITDVERQPERHVSIGHVLDATFDALEPELVAVAPRLAVFPGDFDLVAATAVLDLQRSGGDRHVTRLLDVSLLTTAPSDSPHRRFRVLAPVGEFLRGHLDNIARHDAEARFAEHYHGVAQRFIDHAATSGEAVWLEQVPFEEHNLLAALDWFQQHDPRRALTFAPGLALAWQDHGDHVEGRELLRRLLADAPAAPDDLVAWTEEGLSWLEFLSGEPEAAFGHIVAAIGRFESLGHARGLSRSLGGQAHALHLGGFEGTVTTPLYERAIDIARSDDLEFAVATTEVMFAHALTAAEEHDGRDIEAMVAHAESVLHTHRAHRWLAHACLSRAFLTFGHADAAGGRAASEEMLRQSRLGRSIVWEQIAHVTTGLSDAMDGDDRQAARHFHDAVHLAHDTANRAQLGIALHALAAAASHREPDTAARLWGAAGTMTPLWPLHRRRYGEMSAAARARLGDRWDELVAEGAALSVDEAVGLADTII